MFLANYADGLSDLDLKQYVESFEERGKVACFLSVPAPHTFHIVHSDAQRVSSFFGRRFSTT
jgi:glucose-1-phosphate cytidylyltransferase